MATNDTRRTVEFNTLCDGQCKELCESGICKADCCGCISFREAFFKRLKHLIPDGKEYHLIPYKDKGEDYVKPMTLNGKCVFLSDTNSCVIYGHHLRPDFCKRFGEDKHEPLVACTHINQEFKEVIQEFYKVFLQGQAQRGNSIARDMLK